MQKQSSQIFFEETYVPIKLAKGRLPKECIHILDEKVRSEDFCKMTKMLSKQNQEVTLISAFKTQKREIIKFKTIVLIGLPKDNETVLKSSLKKGLIKK
jgi:precorrin-3B methylase